MLNMAASLTPGCWPGHNHERKEDEDVRVIIVKTLAGHQQLAASTSGNASRATNATRTTKYTLLTFLPKSLFEQYRRSANIYFTVVAALSLTEFSPVRPWTTWTPLLIILGVSIVKEAIEDYRRHKADVEVNNRPVLVLDAASGNFVQRRWRELAAGDVVMARKNEAFPADLLLLSSSNPDGSCYIETMNLDGETNLKAKMAPDATRELTAGQMPAFAAQVRCEGPNSRLYRFVGNLVLTQHKGPQSGQQQQQQQQQTLRGKDGKEEAVVATIAAKAGAPADAGLGPSADSGSSTTVPLSAGALLLRGCSLRNTEHVFGAVVYTGHETKVFCNSTSAPSKRSTLERIVDRIIIAMFITLFAMCITAAVLCSIWVRHELPDHWYLKPDNPSSEFDPSSPGLAGAVSFLVSFILYGYLIPISLYVSIEVVKVIQSMVFIGQDRQMYHAPTDTPALARTSNLNEELGMVNTILTDKTGTLTRNVMEFFKCSIGGVSYGAGITEIERSIAMRKGITLPQQEDPAAARYRERFFNFYDPRLMDGAWMRGISSTTSNTGGAKPGDQRNSGGSSSNRGERLGSSGRSSQKGGKTVDSGPSSSSGSSADAEAIEMFLRLLAVCHTVIPDGPQAEAEIRYEAESPDEAALVVAAKALGFFFIARTNSSVTVRERTASGGTKDVEYQLLNVLEFNSSRKRMSVVVRDASGRLLLFCKGADSVIYERLDPSWAVNKSLKAATSAHMDEYGNAGLRTLCLSYAPLDEAFYAQWSKQYEEAKVSLQDRDARVAAVSELIEKDLRLLGCTAIEDKLQEGVSHCIRQLSQAGIRLWVLTGDKVETAVNIGHACSLLTDDMQQLHVTAATPEVEQLEATGRREEAARTAHAHVEAQLLAARQQAASAGAPGGASVSGHASQHASENHAVSSSKSEGGRSASRGEPPADKGNGGSSTAGAGWQGQQEQERAASGRHASTSSGEPKQLALVIDGKALSYALSQRLSPIFLEVGLQCSAVICCRVSPLQKAQVTALVRSHGDVTLAIGDGANDVGMIQKAHIGVGISGQEGMQAVMSSDFAIAQFRYLERLLLVHGRWSYKRIARMVNFFFYKNLLFGITLFVFDALTRFSGSYPFNDTYMTLYNVVFTALSPLVIGAFDRDVDAGVGLAHPRLYRQGQRNSYFNLRSIAGWLASATCQAGILLTLVILAELPPGADRSDGSVAGMYQLGVTLFSVTVVTVHLQLAALIEQWTWLHHLALWGSTAVWWLFLLAYGALPLTLSTDLQQLLVSQVGPSPRYWLLLLLVPFACLLPEFFWRAVTRLFWPDPQHEVQQQAEPAEAGTASRAAAHIAGPSSTQQQPHQEGQQQQQQLHKQPAAGQIEEGAVSVRGSAPAPAGAAAPPALQQHHSGAAAGGISPRPGAASPHASNQVVPLTEGVELAGSNSWRLTADSQPQQQRSSSPRAGGAAVTAGASGARRVWTAVPQVEGS